MGRKNRIKSKRNVKKRRLDSTASLLCSDACPTTGRAQERKKRRADDVVPSIIFKTTELIPGGINTQNKAGDDQTKGCNMGIYTSVDEKVKSVIETGREKERKSVDSTCQDDTSKPNYATMVRKGLKEITSTLSLPTRSPNIASSGNEEGFVTIYTVKCRSSSFPCLKCTSDDSDAYDTYPKIFFQHEELTVTATVKDKRANDGIPVCSAFDNCFVKKYHSFFITYWKNIVKYVTDDKHIIDLHGLTRPVALAAIEYAVARECQYSKHLHGIGCSNYKKLEIITGRGIHSNGSPVLPEAVQNHLYKLGFEKVKQAARNQGLLEVDVRNAKHNHMSPFYCSWYNLRSG